MAFNESQFEKVFGSKVARINESTGISCELQKGTSFPAVSINGRYINNEGEWAYKKGGFRAVLTSKQLDWLIAELTKVSELLKKVESASVTKKTTDKPKAADDEVDLTTTTVAAAKPAKAKKTTPAPVEVDDEDIVLTLTAQNNGRKHRK